MPEATLKTSPIMGIIGETLPARRQDCDEVEALRGMPAQGRPSSWIGKTPPSLAPRRTFRTRRCSRQLFCAVPLQLFGAQPLLTEQKTRHRRFEVVLQIRSARWPGIPFRCHGRDFVMDTIIKRHGRFELIQNEQGFCWRLITRRGARWYWHPEVRLWTFQCQPSPTEEAATTELDWALSHEDVGDLDEKHIAAPTNPHVSQVDRDSH